MEDASGKPRPEDQIIAAREALRREIVTRPLTQLSDGSFAVMHYTVIVEALNELLEKRAAEKETAC